MYVFSILSVIKKLVTKIAKICFKFSSITIVDKCNDRNAFICLAHGFYSTHNRYLWLNSIRCCNSQIRVNSKHILNWFNNHSSI